MAKLGLKGAVKPALKDDPLTMHFIDEVMSEHFRLLCQPQGLFEDPMSGVAFRGRSRRIRIALILRNFNVSIGKNTTN